MKITKKQLKQIIKEEMGSLHEWESQHAAMARYARQAARAQAGKSQPPGSDRPTADTGPAMGQPSSEDTLRSSIMDAIDLLKAGNAEDALGQLQATLDATTGGAGLDKGYGA